MDKDLPGLRGFARMAALSLLLVGVGICDTSVAGADTSLAPVVLSLSPTFAIVGNSVLVEISGANFDGATAVTFGSQPAATFEVDTSTSIAATTPPGITGTVDVTVTTAAGTSATTSMDKFVFEGPSSSPPVVTSVAPSSGLGKSGVLVDVQGSNFIGATAVHFGSMAVPAGSFSVLSATELGVFNIPAEAVGTVADITVTTAAGTSALSPADKFTYAPPPPPANGYWEVASDGGIFSFGSAPFLGSMGGKHLNAPVVGMASDDSANGYWEVASDGGIFSFGSAPFYGSMGGTHLNSPIVGMALDVESGGYWEVAADGGVFSFHAPFLGSLGGTHLPSPIVGMAPSNNGSYWLAAADGTVYSFGAATDLGSVAKPPSRPVISITSVPSASVQEYWLVTADGTIFTFGGAPNEGSTAGMRLNKPLVGMTPGINASESGVSQGLGYWEAGADGGIFTFGTPGYYGSMGGDPLNAPVVGIASTLQPTLPGPD
jgi:IPT/TIG domain